MAPSVGDDSPPDADTGVAQGRYEKPEGGTAPLEGASSPPEGASGEPEGETADLVSARSFLPPVGSVKRDLRLFHLSPLRRFDLFPGEPPATPCTAGGGEIEPVLASSHLHAPF